MAVQNFLMHDVLCFVVVISMFWDFGSLYSKTFAPSMVLTVAAAAICFEPDVAASSWLAVAAAALSVCGELARW